MNTKELRKLILSELRDLLDGKTTNSRAANVARLAKTALSAKDTEIRVKRFRLETGEDENSVEL